MLTTSPFGKTSGANFTHNYSANPCLRGNYVKPSYRLTLHNEQSATQQLRIQDNTMLPALAGVGCE